MWKWIRRVVCWGGSVGRPSRPGPILCFIPRRCSQISPEEKVLPQEHELRGEAHPGVAWFAHIGGFLMGAILIPFLKKNKIKFFTAGNKNSKAEKFIRLRFRK